MDKLLKIIGIVVLIWIAFIVLGWIFKFLVGTVLWIAIIVGVVFVISWAWTKGKQVGGR